jgi:hypothetical protein
MKKWTGFVITYVSGLPMCYGIMVVVMGPTLARMGETRNAFQNFGRKIFLEEPT